MCGEVFGFLFYFLLESVLHTVDFKQFRLPPEKQLSQRVITGPLMRFDRCFVIQSNLVVYICILLR